MRAFEGRSATKQWARLAMKIGLMLTDAKLWSLMSQRVQDRAEDVGDVVRDRYEDAADRLRDVRSSLRGDTHWVAPTLSFLGGIGVGVGIGMLLAPMSGEEARAAIRDKATDVSNKVNDFATGASRYRSANQPTGTEI